MASSSFLSCSSFSSSSLQSAQPAPVSSFTPAKPFSCHTPPLKKPITPPPPPANTSPSTVCSGHFRSTSTSRAARAPRPAAVTDHVQSVLSFDTSSLHERAKDILVFVAGLLFGIDCTSLAGAIMYLVWLLFTDQYEICRSGHGENEEEENPKKMGYVMIADPVNAKERYEEN